LAVPVDRGKAVQYFQAAAGQDLAEAQVNLAKMSLEHGELQPAVQYLEVALRHQSPFEAFHLLASIHATTARVPPAQGGRPGMCGVSVAWFKLVAEKGSWRDNYMGEADKAWARGEEENAMIGWWIAAELGIEAGQNNVAFLLDKGYTLGGINAQAGNRTSALALWIRSAAQDNVDAMVKVGDHYFEAHDIEGDRYEKAATYYQTAADTQTSAMAYWNLGYMYENGLGVSRDWHLAKRFYDLSYEASTEAYLPVLLSLIKLHLRR
jgi:SEL1 protein